MPSLLHLAHGVSPLAASLLIASFWQAALLTLGVALALRFLPGLSPAVRSQVWTAVLLLVLALPVLAVVWPHVPNGGRGELHVAESWSLVLLVVWGLGSAIRAAQLASHAVGLWRLAAHAVPVPTEPAVAALLAGPRRAELCVSAEVNRPSVAGFFRPRVLLPVGLLETLSPAELEHVVLHEMEHLRRYDDWLNLLQQIGLLLLPLNPALLWLDRRLCRERELACDDGVLQATRAHKAYAACLVKLAEESMMRKGMLLALSALGSALGTKARESELVVRVRRILARPESGEKAGSARLGMGLLAAGMIAGAVGLVCSPQWVSFDGGPVVTTAAESAMVRMPTTSARGAEMMPVVARPEQTLGRPVAAVAVMDRAFPRAARSVPAVAVERRHARLRAAGITTGVAAQRTWMPARAWMPVRTKATAAAPDLERAPVLQQTRADVGAEAPARARVVVTEFEVSQPLYAAVPWRGGWLIVQL